MPCSFDELSSSLPEYDVEKLVLSLLPVIVDWPGTRMTILSVTTNSETQNAAAAAAAAAKKRC